MRIMPAYLPNHKLLVYLSGLAEMVLGIAIFIPQFLSTAIYGILLMLLAFMPVHIYMLKEKKASLGIPKWLLLVRVVLQFALMYWAWSYLQL